MKTKNVPLSKWLWMFGVYLAGCVVGLIICSVLVNGGNLSFEGCGFALAVVVFISGFLMALLSKGLPILGLGVPVGIIILLNIACCILIYSGIGDGFLLQNGALILGGLFGFWIINKGTHTAKGKRRRKRYG